MSSRVRCGGALVLSLLGACGGPIPRVDLPPPVESTTVGVGDVIELEIVGEDKLPKSFTVASDGTVDLPYIKRTKIAGLEPQEVQQVIRAALIEQKILTDPSVSVSLKEYNSKRVEVLGEVQKPGSLPLMPGMTLLRAISLAGGFNALAAKDRVVIRRRVEGRTRAVLVSVEDIMENRLDDIPLQAGDSIEVKQRRF